MDMAKGEGATWSGLRDKTRNMIRKGQRAGLTVVTDANCLKPAYDVYADHMLALGVSIHSFRFFETACRHLGDRFRRPQPDRKRHLIGIGVGQFTPLGKRDEARIHAAAFVEPKRFAKEGVRTGQHHGVPG